ncbi:uncharacterized protein LOC121503694 isoform X2 [Cheilinus undulatus]|uniref:uncharacterized protein LOC121503694 isoform X2 n=1 Tax=Cheilinus undulatus TaxID=241271 RepID=UPI001BD66650|nr:uncharacterized protein LOC121503694 isoform X2 [Cheilinus undulatus]
MSQHAQHCLIRVLLLWVCMLSISQVVFITLYFSAGHHNRPPPEPKPRLGKGKMLNFIAHPTTDSGAVKWRPRYDTEGLVTVKDEVLTIDKDGYYFLNLQVTLQTCKNVSLLEGHSNLIVKVMWTNKNEKRTILEGRINMDTCSTGLLAMVTAFSSEATLVTKINMETPKINHTDSLTHLDIIYMQL